MNLDEMTQERWSGLTYADRAKIRDLSDCNPQLLPYKGKKVRVTPKRLYGRSTFRVGMTMGWRPCLLAMRAGSYGSSDTIGVSERFATITVLD